jgi:PncC family amidohydrolase
MMTDSLAVAALHALQRCGMTLATAESCTGGWLGKLLTDVPGSSAHYLGGVISYDNSVKELLLGVPHEILLTVGAVSEETAVAMAKGVRNLLHADLAVAVTGIAGPNADGTNKPVGLVYVAVVSESQTVVSENHFSGDREAVRGQAAVEALKLILELN